MASIKVKFRPSNVSRQEGTIYYQVIHERKTRQLCSCLHLLPSEWDVRRSLIIDPSESSRRSFLISQREKIRKDLDRFSRIIRSLESTSLTYSADDVIDEFCRYVREYSLVNYMEHLIGRLHQTGKIRTSETYRSALKSFMKFRDGEDIMLDCISPEVMEAYESWLKKRGNSYNTISFYTRILRAVYNRAVNDHAIEDATPFRHVYTGIAKTVKRALPLKTISRIKSLNLSGYPALEFARDIFILSFMLRGMSFIDMAFLKKTDLKGGHITYNRRKTGQRLVIAWTREMQTILDRYPANPTRYLLPIICRPDVNELSSYRNAAYTINRNLKKIASKAGVSIPLTLYVARHSWASAAKTKGIPISVISEGMGHDNEATTRIYLASLETSVVDKANAIILKSL